MPKKKDIQIHLRLKPAELEPLDADRKALPGVPVSRVAYVRHVVTTYPGELRRAREQILKLQTIESRVRNASVDEDGTTPRSSAIMEFALDLLREAGL